MVLQNSFFDYWDRRSVSIQAAFLRFHAAHPEVFSKFREYAEELYQRGHRRYSADMILGRIRWHFQIEKGDRDWKVNDHFTSRYARLLMSTYGKFAGFFELRRLRGGE